MTEKLLSEFPPASTQQWETVIEKDLKGADYNKKLMWKTDEGVSVHPYYRMEHLQEVKHLDGTPGCFPFIRGTKEDNKWLVRQGYCAHQDFEEANRQALDGIAKGVESVGFCIDGAKACSEDGMTALLKGIDLERVEVNFEGCRCTTALSYINSFTAYIQKQGVHPQLVHASFDVDPLSCPKECVDTVQSFPNIRVVGVEGYAIHAAGSGIVQELGFGLAMGSESLNRLIEQGTSPDEAAGRIKFTFAVGANYFMEIAKFRAGRLLWAHIVQEYGATQEGSMKMKVHAVTSPWNQTVYDPYVNMLRGTTEAMSASIAGVDSLEVLPFDYAFRTPGEFSNRIARNTQIILKEEAYFDKVVDPSAGSYYIEKLTQSIADEAWKLFTEVEEKGGYLAAYQEGFIQEQVKATAQKRDKNIATRRDTLLGTNQYPNFNEKADLAVTQETVTHPQAHQSYQALETHEIHETYKTHETLQSHKTVEPLTPYRGAQSFEQLRFAIEKSGKRPKAFMLTFGNLTMCRARAQFACNFFAVAGFEVIDNNRFATIEEGIEAAQAVQADIVVACSADDEYQAAVPQIAKLLGCTTHPELQSMERKCIVVVAGEPECKPELEAQGITHFISVKSNVLETLRQYRIELGI